MQRPSIVLAVLLLACGCNSGTARRDASAADSVAMLAAALEPPAPVGLYGEWLRVAPASLAGDTLRLRADSTADGVIPWYPGLARISRWKVVYASRAPATERMDWRYGHKNARGRVDGGEAGCVVGKDRRGCRSLPTLCLGASGQYACEAFVFTRDSLLMQEHRYVRLASRSPSLERRVPLR